MHEKVSTVLRPLPSYGFDPTEVAIPWELLTEKIISVEFATPSGSQASAHSLLVSGEKLGKWMPALQARHDAIAACEEMEKDESFCSPVKYIDARVGVFTSILLPAAFLWL